MLADKREIIRASLNRLMVQKQVSGKGYDEACHSNTEAWGLITTNKDDDTRPLNFERMGYTDARQLFGGLDSLGGYKV